MGGTGVFYTFRRAVFHEPQRATTTACPLACGWSARDEPLGLVDQRGARRAREALERAQRERRLAALDLDRPGPGDEPVDQVAGADLQVAPLVDGVAVLVGQDARPALGGVGEQDAVEGGQQARRRRRLGVGPRRVGQVVERAAVLVLEALELAPRRSSAARTGGVRQPIQPATSSGPAGPNARRWRRTTSSSALSPFSAPRGRGAASRALGAFVPQAPSAGTRTKADQRWNGRHLSSRWRSSSACRERLGMLGDPLLDERADLLGAARRPARVGPQLGQQLLDRGAGLVVGAPPVVAAPPRRRPRRRPGARARTRGAGSRAAACRRRARRRRAPRRRRRARSPRPATTAPPAAPASTAPAGRRRPRRRRPAAASRRSSSPWRASSARLSAVVVMR